MAGAPQNDRDARVDERHHCQRHGVPQHERGGGVGASVERVNHDTELQRRRTVSRHDVERVVDEHIRQTCSRITYFI